MFNTFPQLRRPLGLAKVLASSLRQGVSLIRNLTVLPCLLFLSVSFSSIARRALSGFLPSLAATGVIIAGSPGNVNPLFHVFCLFHI